jgi:hypothetical protein
MNNDFLKDAKTVEKKLTNESKNKLQRLVNQVVSLDEGGKVKTDQEKGGISCSQSVKNKDYSKTKIFKDLISYLGETPSLKLLFDILSYYLNKKRKITHELLPALMQQLGLLDCTLPDGHTVAISTDHRIAVIDQEEFFSWLKKKGYGDYIKMNLALQGEDFTDEFKKFLKESGISYEKKYDIHWKSRNKIILDRIEANEDLPSEKVLSVTPIEKAEVK